MGVHKQMLCQLALKDRDIPQTQKTMRKFEQGRYTATDVRWGMTLDLSGEDRRSLIGYGFHGLKNQQVRTSHSFFPFAPRPLIVAVP